MEILFIRNNMNDNKNKKEIKKEYKNKKKELRKNYHNEKKELHLEYNEELDRYFEVQPNSNNNPPRRTVLEEIGNAVSHGSGVILAVVALVFMLKKVDSTIALVASLVYFSGLFILFTMSALYHSFSYGSKVKRLFRRFDYSSIYLLIGSTYAPIVLCYVGGKFGIIFFIVQWLIIITGITLIGVFGPNRLKYIHFPLYFILGWSAILFLPRMIREDLNLFLWILSGGIIYCLGMIPFLRDRKVSHFIWHIFVLLGAIVQWIGIYLYIL